MPKSFFTLILLFMVMPAWGASYYSQGSLAPDLISSWNTERGGGGSTPPDFTGGDIFVVQGGDTMTTSAAWGLSGPGSRLQIEDGGILVSTFAVTLASATIFQIDSGGLYRHSNTAAYGSTIFQGTESFSSGSTVEINNSNTTGPSGVAFGNLVIDFTADPGGSINCAGGVTTVNGDLVVQSTSTREFRLSGNTAYTLALGGDLAISGGTLNAASGSNTGVNYRINCAGSYQQTGGTFKHGNANSPLDFRFTCSGGSFGWSGGTLDSTNINWTVEAGASLAMDTSWPVAASRSLNVAGDLSCGASLVTGSGSFRLDSGATLGIGSPEGICVADTFGNIRVSGARSFSTGASYRYGGAGNQLSGDGLPDTVDNLTVATSDTMFLYKYCMVSGTINLTGGVFVPGGNNILGISRPLAGSTSNFRPDPAAILYVWGTAPGIVLPATVDSLHSLVLENPGGLSISTDLRIIGDGLYMIEGSIQPNGNALHYDNTGLYYQGSEAQVTSDAEFPESDGPFFLSIENPQGVTLHADRAIPWSVDFLSGLLYTGQHILSLYPSANIYENDDSYAVGRVRTKRFLEQDVTESFGGMGLEITASGAAPESTVVTRTTGTSFGGSPTVSIERSFEVVPSVNSGLDATMVFWYREGELNGIAEEDLSLFRSEDAGLHWIEAGGTVSTDDNYVTLSGIDSLSLWTLGDHNNPLAVHLSSFSALATDGKVVLSWRTESESRSYMWIVERSSTANGGYTELVGLPAAGSSTVPRDYSWTDGTAQPGMTFYYRLGELGLDGITTYYGPVSCSLGHGLPSSDMFLGCAPSPFRRETVISYQVAAAAAVDAAVYNVAGQLVRKLDHDRRAPGNYSARWDGTDGSGRKLSAGIYICRVAIGQKVFQRRVLLVR